MDIKLWPPHITHILEEDDCSKAIDFGVLTRHVFHHLRAATPRPLEGLAEASADVEAVAVRRPPPHRHDIHIRRFYK